MGIDGKKPASESLLFLLSSRPEAYNMKKETPEQVATIFLVILWNAQENPWAAAAKAINCLCHRGSSKYDSRTNRNIFSD